MLTSTHASPLATLPITDQVRQGDNILITYLLFVAWPPGMTRGPRLPWALKEGCRCFVVDVRDASD